MPQLLAGASASGVEWSYISPGWEAMGTLEAFLVRPVRSLFFLTVSLLCAAFLSVPTSAQHGGAGGGHGGFGGHFGGGHSGHSGGHADSSGNTNSGGHFRWMKGRHSARTASAPPDPGNNWTSSSWSFNTPGLVGSSHGLPSTMMWSPGRLEPKSGHEISFASAPPHFRHCHPFRHHPFFGSSACFFNGISQVC